MNNVLLLNVPDWPHVSTQLEYTDVFAPSDDCTYIVWLKHIGDPLAYPNHMIYDGTVLNTIPNDWVQYINAGKIHIVVDTAEESWGPIYDNTINHVDSADIHQLLKDGATRHGIDPTKVTWLTGDMNAEVYCSQSAVNVKSVCQFLFSFPALIKKLDYSSTGHTIDNFLICPNRFPKAHRGYTVTKLTEIEESSGVPMRISFPKDIEFVPSNTIIDAFYKLHHRKAQYPDYFDTKELIDWQDLEQQMRALHRRLPRKIDDVDFNTNWCAAEDAISSIKSYYHRSAFCLVTETWAEGRKLFVSDATLAPILNKTPFIVVGCKGTLQFLRDKGFKTFDSVIDESYDNIVDDVERWNAALTQVEILSHTDWIGNRAQLDDIVNHNFNHMFDLALVEEQDLIAWLTSL